MPTFPDASIMCSVAPVTSFAPSDPSGIVAVPSDVSACRPSPAGAYVRLFSSDAGISCVPRSGIGMPRLYSAYSRIAGIGACQCYQRAVFCKGAEWLPYFWPCRVASSDAPLFVVADAKLLPFPRPANIFQTFFSKDVIFSVLGHFWQKSGIFFRQKRRNWTDIGGHTHAYARTLVCILHPHLQGYADMPVFAILRQLERLLRVKWYGCPQKQFGLKIKRFNGILRKRADFCADF